MQIPRLFFLLAFSIYVTLVHAQSHTPTSLEPGKRNEYYAPSRTKATKARKGKAKHTKEYEFYERVEKAAHEKKKIAKRLAKAQFSDYRYFGHKHIPKRRPTYKMTYCNECGIRH